MPATSSATAARARRGRAAAERAVGDQADHDDVGDRADAGPLPQRDPQQQHDDGGEVDDQPDGQADPLGDALVEDVPRAEAEVGPHHQPQADPEEHQAGEQPEQPA